MRGRRNRALGPRNAASADINLVGKINGFGAGPHCAFERSRDARRGDLGTASRGGRAAASWVSKAERFFVPVCTENSNPDVMMVKSAEDRV